MGRLGFDKVLDCFSLSIPTSARLCMNSQEEEEFEKRSLMTSHADQLIKLRGLFEEAKTLACHLEPKSVTLKVSMHCNGCARKVGKHISKMEGVTSFQVDLENKKVVVMGDITPFEVLQSVSKIKFAEFWLTPNDIKEKTIR